MSTSDKGLPSVSNPAPNVTQPKPITAAATPAVVRTAAPQPTTPAQMQRPATPATKQSIAQQSTAAYGPTPGARADLLYGATGSTKTSRLGDIAEYIWRKYKQRSRLISADPGGWETIEALIRSEHNPDGIIDAFALGQHRENIYETMEKLTLGWWPADVNDAQSKLVAPAQNGLRETGGVFFEGLTSWCDIMMRTNLTDMKNINVPRSANEKENLLSSGDFQHRFASQTDYGSIQQIIAEFVRNSGMLPVKKVVWTALEQKGEDDQKKPVYGPDIIGRKATSQCGPWFGNFLHLDFITVIEKIKNPLGNGEIETQVPKPFIFLRSHVDPSDPFKMPWPAKTRASKTYWANVPPVMEPDMSKFYTFMDSLLQKEKDARAIATQTVQDKK